MIPTARRRFAWMFASMLWASCGASAEKVEEPRAPAEDKGPADPDEFVITDEPDRDVPGDDDESTTAEKPASVDELKAEKAVAEREPEAEPKPEPKAKPTPKKAKKKKVVERDPEPERVAAAEDDSESSDADEERPAKRVRINRSSVGAGRADREARMARDQRAREKGRRGKGAREEEDEEDKEAREEEARAAKEARAEKAREAKEARAQKALAAKEAREEKLRKAKEAREAKTREAAEAKKTREAKAAKKPSADEDVESDDTADEEAEEEETKPAPKKVAKKAEAVDPDMIEMDEEEEEEPPSGRVASIEDDTGDPLSENEVDTVAPAVPVASTVAINDRPLTVAPKKLELHGGLRLLTLAVPGTGAASGTTVKTTSEALSLGVAYGLGKKTEVGADYTLSLNPGTVKGPLALHVAYSAKQGKKLDFAIAAGLAFDFDQTPNAVTMTTITTSYASLQLGAWARYHVTPKVSLFTGLPALPSAAPSLSKQSLALPPFAYQVAIGLNNAGTTAVDVPLGLGVQVMPNIYAFASLDFAHIRIANTPSAYLFADFIPFALGAFYSRNKLDIGLQLADDLKRGADYLRVETVLRYSVK